MMKNGTRIKNKTNLLTINNFIFLYLLNKKARKQNIKYKKKGIIKLVWKIKNLLSSKNKKPLNETIFKRLILFLNTLLFKKLKI